MGPDVLDSELSEPEFGGSGDSEGIADKVMSTGWLAFAGIHSVFIGAGSAGMLAVGKSELLSLGAYWGTKAGIVLCVAVLLWMEYRWRGASGTELAKLSSFWYWWVRLTEVLLLVSAKIWLVSCVAILWGGDWIGALVYPSFGGLAAGWIGIGLALQCNRRVGFYTAERETPVEVEPVVDQSVRRGSAFLVDGGWLQRSPQDSTVWHLVPWTTSARRDSAAASDSN
jgi:hypothetical protein